MQQNKNQCVLFSQDKEHFAIIDYGKHSFYQLENVEIAMSKHSNFLWSYHNHHSKTQGYFINLVQMFTNKDSQLNYFDQIIFFKNMKQFGILTHIKKGEKYTTHNIDSIKSNSQTQKLPFEKSEFSEFSEQLFNLNQKLYIIDPVKAHHFFREKYEW